jgi:peptidoglycan/LPS O-acetylase OafA/YrhL
MVETAAGLGSGPAEQATPAPTTSAPRRVHFPCFDGLRAIAALSVLVTHVAFVSGFNIHRALGHYTARMDAGVAVFFVISGFLLYRPFVRARFTDRPPLAVMPYLRRRFLRIFPAWWLILTVALVGFRVGGHRDVTSLVMWYGLVHIYRPQQFFAPVAQSWTLATEISFYAFLPLWAYGMRRLKGSPERRLATELAGVALLVVVAVLWRAGVYWTGTHDDGVYNAWLPAWFDMFGLGMLMAVYSVWTSELGRPLRFRLDRRFTPAIAWILAGVSFWAIATRMSIPRNAVYFSHVENYKLHYFYLATAFFLVLPAVFGPQDRGLVRGFLRTRVMVYLGVISYGVYLWHELWLNQYSKWTHARPFATPLPPVLLAVLALTIASASLSWYFFEKPILKLKDRSLRDVMSRDRTRTPVAQES